MRRIYVFLTVLMILTTSMAQANCLPVYREKLKFIDARMSGFKTSITTTAISEAALVGTLILVTGTVAAGSVMVMPATIVGAGSYLGYLQTQKSKYNKAFKLIKEAQAGKGKRLDKALRSINKKLGTDIEKDTLASLIKRSNEDKTFCELDETTEKVKLLGYAKVMRYLRDEVRAGL